MSSYFIPKNAADRTHHKLRRHASHYFFKNAFGREGRLVLLTGWNEREKRGLSCLWKRCLRCRDSFTLPVSV